MIKMMNFVAKPHYREKIIGISFAVFFLFAFLIRSVFATPLYGPNNVILDPTCTTSNVNCTVGLLEVFDEGVSQTNDTISFDFVGSGVTATQSGGAVTVTIPGGGGSMAIGGAVTSGTQGSVYFGGTGGVLTQDNANLFWDDSTNRLGVGTSAPSHALDIVSTAINPSAARSAINGSLTVSNSLNNNQTYAGGSFSIEKTDNNNEAAGNIIGVYGISTISGNGTTSAHAGVIGNAVIGASSAANQGSSYGLYGLVTHEGSGVISTAAAIGGSVNNNGSGSITNAFGLRLSAPTVGTSSNYGVYISGAAPNYFQGNVGIGDTTPSVALDVSGAIAATTSINAGTTVNATTQYNLNGDFFAAQDAVTNFNLRIGDGSGNGGDKNTFLGIDAGASNTTGYYNSFIGYKAGYSNTTGHFNIFIGESAGYSHTSNGDNVFIGNTAGFADISGASNTFVGKGAGSTNTSGLANTALGAGARMTNPTDEYGIALGYGAIADSYQFALSGNITGWKFRGNAYTLPSSSVAGAFVNDGSGGITWQTIGVTVQNTTSLFGTGVGAGTSSSAQNSVFLGADAGDNATAAHGSVFIGSNAGSGATDATLSNFIGSGAGFGADQAEYSNFIGVNAGEGATDTQNSNFIGTDAGRDATNVTHGNFFGVSAGQAAENASHSVFIGTSAGANADNASYSVFLGYGVGASSTTNNTATNVGNNCDTTGCYSIAIGRDVSTNGYSNSIAIGMGATNTATNQFMIGSNTRPINDVVINGSGFTTCSVNTVSGVGISCSSDERLKTNISDLPQNTLSKILQLRTVNFSWINNDDGMNHIGFLAQNLAQQYPELVSTAANGYLQVNYAGMTPILVQAIRELDLKVSGLQSMTDETFVGNIRTWLASATNGINRIFSKEIVTDKICIRDDQGETCLTRSEINTLLNTNGQSTGGNGNPGGEQNGSGDDEEILDGGTDEEINGSIDDNNPPEENSDDGSDGDEIIPEIEETPVE